MLTTSDRIESKSKYDTFRPFFGHVTDTITLDNNMMDALDNFMPLVKYDENIGQEVYYVPSDIILSQTVPILDMELHLSEYNNGTHIFKIHVCDKIVSEFLQAMNNAVKTDSERAIAKLRDGKYCLTVGYIECTWKLDPTNLNVWIGCPIEMSFDEYSDQIFPIIEDAEIRPRTSRFQEVTLNNEKATYELAKMFTLALISWYQIQLALLNPLTKVCFREHKLPVHSTNKNRKSKRPIRYIKRLTFSASEFNDAINPEHLECKDGKYTRKTMIWHVAGHWHRTKNGKRVFVKGYWKGPLRDLEKNKHLFEPREREIVR